MMTGEVITVPADSLGWRFAERMTDRRSFETSNEGEEYPLRGVLAPVGFVRTSPG